MTYGLEVKNSNDIDLIDTSSIQPQIYKTLYNQNPGQFPTQGIIPGFPSKLAKAIVLPASVDRHNIFFYTRPKYSSASNGRSLCYCLHRGVATVRNTLSNSAASGQNYLIINTGVYSTSSSQAYSVSGVAPASSSSGLNSNPVPFDYVGANCTTAGMTWSGGSSTATVIAAEYYQGFTNKIKLTFNKNLQQSHPVNKIVAWPSFDAIFILDPEGLEWFSDEYIDIAIGVPNLEQEEDNDFGVEVKNTNGSVYRFSSNRKNFVAVGQLFAPTQLNLGTYFIRTLASGIGIENVNASWPSIEVTSAENLTVDSWIFSNATINETDLYAKGLANSAGIGPSAAHKKFYKACIWFKIGTGDHDYEESHFGSYGHPAGYIAYSGPAISLYPTPITGSMGGTSSQEVNFQTSRCLIWGDIF
jgi:hypothetical protein